MSERLLLLGCGILKREVRHLIEKNGWPLDTLFIDSMLHVNFEALAEALQGILAKHAGQRTIVFYGACHPLMDRMLEEAHTIRTEGQNCVEMLLGSTRFNEELAGGAFFLLEEWAHRWDYMIDKTFGRNDDITREIFRGDRGYLLYLKTPCSGDFLAEAEEAGRRVGLPLRRMDVTLDHLEAVLQMAIEAKI